MPGWLHAAVELVGWWFLAAVVLAALYVLFRRR